MKSTVTLQDKLAKQNEISRQRLAQELVKLEKVEKSDLKMIETARHRFRLRHKNLEARQPSSGSTVRSARSRGKGQLRSRRPIIRLTNRHAPVKLLLSEDR